MPNTRDLSLDEYGISKARYRELYYFCLQYKEMVAEKNDCYSLSGRIRSGYNMNHSSDEKHIDIWPAYANSAKNDTMANKVVKIIGISEKIQMIEQSAIEAGGGSITLDTGSGNYG